MNTAKEALLAAGRIKEVGRGRISNDNHIWLLDQVSKGVKFSDYPKTGRVGVSTTTPTGETTYVKPPAPTGEVIAELFYRYDETEWKAVAKDGTVFSMREVCQQPTCGYSLVGHFCDSPKVLGKSVEVVRR